MSHIETFTDKTPGSLDAFDALVELCPRCGRPGIERPSAEGRSFVHAETSELLSDGLLTVPVEACPLESLPFALHRPDAI